MSCEHEQQRLTRRQVRGGAVQYVYQCVTCGSSMNQPIAHSRIASEFAGQEIVDFDETIERSYIERRVAELNQERDTKLAAMRTEYAEYLKGPKWADKRRRVLGRCNGICEGCGDAPAVEVHHLTYEHAQDEFLFELVGLCKACHKRAHVDDGAAS